MIGEWSAEYGGWGAEFSGKEPRLDREMFTNPDPRSSFKFLRSMKIFVISAITIIYCNCNYKRLTKSVNYDNLNKQTNANSDKNQLFSFLTAVFVEIM